MNAALAEYMGWGGQGSRSSRCSARGVCFHGRYMVGSFVVVGIILKS